MKPYIRPMPASWWLKRPSYLLFMMRELSCVFVGGYVVIFLLMLRNLSRGPAEYEAYMAMLRSPLAIAFHIVALAFALLHTITWFQATPKAMAVWKGEERLPAAMMIIPNYVGWVVASAVVAWVVLAG
jgi:fumarate reductase subunit C